MTQNYTLTREIPLDDSYDVIVAGGGPAGCAAAAAAARDGAKTLLIEATGCLGGMGTQGLVPAWCPFTDSEKIIYSGLAAAVLKRCIAGMPHVAEDHYNWTPIDPELLKRIYDDLVTDAGASVAFNTFLTGVDAGEGQVRALIVADKSGLRALKAPIYVDCTGDADLATWAGAEYEQGDERGELQPATLCFMLANVDDYAYRTGPQLHPMNKKSPIYDIMASGRFPLVPDPHMCNNVVGPGCIGFNAGHLWPVDNTDPASVSQALITGRRLAEQYRQALAEFHPRAYAGAHLASTAGLMGIRETRRILGDYYLTLEDLKALKTFDDEIARNCYYVDIHRSKRDIESGKTASGADFAFPRGKSHGIPYRCLTPRGLANVLVTGRSISTDRSSQGSTRVMPVCLSTGEAAGAAAAQAAKLGGETRKVDIAALRETLRAAGGYLP